MQIAREFVQGRTDLAAFYLSYQMGVRSNAFSVSAGCLLPFSIYIYQQVLFAGCFWIALSPVTSKLMP